jgi:hypothetical protein
MKKSFYIVRLVFQNYTTQPFRAELTPKQANGIVAMLDKRKREGTLMDYRLGPPTEPEWVHALVLSSETLKVELDDLIETERRLSGDR